MFMSEEQERKGYLMIGESMYKPFCLYSRAMLEKVYGKVWDATEAGAIFTFRGTMGNLVDVTHKETGQEGHLRFQEYFEKWPRFYYAFRPYNI